MNAETGLPVTWILMYLRTMGPVGLMKSNLEWSGVWQYDEILLYQNHPSILRVDLRTTTWAWSKIFCVILFMEIMFSGNDNDATYWIKSNVIDDLSMLDCW